MTRTLSIVCALIMMAGTASVQAESSDWHKMDLAAGSGQEEQEDGKDQDNGQDQDEGKEQGEGDKGQEELLLSMGLSEGIAPAAPRWRQPVTSCFARNSWGRTFQATVRGSLSRRGLNALQWRAVQTCRRHSPFFMRSSCQPIGCRSMR